MSNSRVVVVTGANRGIGLELVRQLARGGARIFAGCRRPDAAGELAALEREHAEVTMVGLDVTDDASVAAAVAVVGDKTDHVDDVINNAGQNPRESFATFDAAQMLGLLDVNVVGALRVTRAAFGLLRASTSPRVAFVSSQLGSLELQCPGFGSLGYNTSKAALNMVARKLSIELAGDAIATVSIHPGWVRTDMGGPNASIEVEESAAGILAILRRLELSSSGQFLCYDGTPHPW